MLHVCMFAGELSHIKYTKMINPYGTIIIKDKERLTN